MVTGVDRLRLNQRAMIHPDDHIALWIAFDINGYGEIVGIEHDKRTGRIEADADDVLRFHTGPGEAVANHDPNGPPDIVRGLFDEVRPGPPDLNRLGG